VGRIAPRLEIEESDPALSSSASLFTALDHVSDEPTVLGHVPSLQAPEYRKRIPLSPDELPGSSEGELTCERLSEMARILLVRSSYLAIRFLVRSVSPISRIWSEKTVAKNEMPDVHPSDAASLDSEGEPDSWLGQPRPWIDIACEQVPEAIEDVSMRPALVRLNTVRVTAHHQRCSRLDDLPGQVSVPRGRESQKIHSAVEAYEHCVPITGQGSHFCDYPLRLEPVHIH